jgi:hypothetical protein
VKLVIQHPGMRSTYLVKELSIGESSLRSDVQRIKKLAPAFCRRHGLMLLQ